MFVRDFHPLGFWYEGIVDFLVEEIVKEVTQQKGNLDVADYSLAS